MTTHLVTFSDANMSESSWRLAQSSKAHGVGTHARFNPGNISTWTEVKEHPEIFRQPEDARRAWGWWAWKPLVIKREMEWLPEGSILIYSDAGIEFIDNVNYIIDRMDQDILLFGNMWEHAHWCKADIVNEVWPVEEWAWEDEWEYGQESWSRFGKQVQASVIFFRVSDYSRQFVKEWLDWCLFEGGRLIDDSPSRLPNHPEFRENRHDQAILTTMAYREGIKLHWWPSVYNRGGSPEFIYEKGYYVDDYPVIFSHHRKRNHEWEQVA